MTITFRWKDGTVTVSETCMLDADYMDAIKQALSLGATVTIAPE